MSRVRLVWEPKVEDYDRVFVEQNPWHKSGEVPDALARDVERPFARWLPSKLLNDNPRRFQLILGPRRVGKTTAMYQAVRSLLGEGIQARRLWWLRLDHALLMQMPLDTLVRGIVQAAQATPASPAFVFFDELTYADSWDLWLKTFYDEQWPIRVVGSSSATAALRDRRLESGIGRWEEQFLTPYMFSEQLELVGKKVDIPVEETLVATIAACVRREIQVNGLADERRRFLLTGGFPELLIDLKPTSNDEFLLLRSQRILQSDAVERAIYKDIPQAFKIDNPMLLERLLYTLAGQVAGLLSPQSICRDLAGLTQPTFDRYLGYLERTFLVFTLPNYSGSESSVQKRGRKLYFVDSAVRNAALQRGLGPLTDPAEMGLLIENMAASHLHVLGQQSQVRLYHWRDKNEEIDLVYDHPDSPLAFEIGMSEYHSRRGIHAFEGRFPRFKGKCFVVAPDAKAAMPSDTWDKIGTLPLDLFLLAVGAQAERHLAERLRA